MSAGDVHAILEDRDGTLWVGTTGGLDRMDRSARAFVHYRNDPRDDSTLTSNAVLCLYEDHRGQLWVGTRAGLNVLQKTTGRVARFRHDPADPHSLGHDYVGAIREDRSGVLWVASTFGSGLSALYAHTRRFVRFSFHAEEPGAEAVTGVSSLYVDRDGILWLCTLDRALLKLDPAVRRFVRYSRDPVEPNTLPTVRDVQRHNNGNPVRCQRMSVSGFTTVSK